MPIRAAAKTATTAAGKAVAAKAAGVVAAVLLPIIAVAVLVYALVGMMSNFSVKEAQDVITEFAEETGERLALVYLDAENHTDAPWPLIAAVAGIQTTHGLNVPDDSTRRGVDEDTAVTPTALPPIEVTPVESEVTYEGIFLIDTKAVAEADVLEAITTDDAVQIAEQSAIAIGTILSAAVDADPEWSGEPAMWADERDVWIRALEVLPIMSMDDPYEGAAAPEERCSDDGVLIGDSISDGLEATGTLDNLHIDAAVGRTVAAALTAAHGLLDDGWTGRIVVNIGTNGWGTLETLDGVTATPSEALGELADRVAAGQLVFVKPRDVGAADPAISDTVVAVREAIDEVAATASEAEISVIDLAAWPADADSFAADGIHLTADGYRGLAEWLHGRLCSPSRTAGFDAAATPLADRIWALAMRYAGYQPEFSSYPDVPPIVMQAYIAAVEWGMTAWPECGIDLPLLAAVGKVETNHGQGREFTADGTVTPPVFANRAIPSYPNNLSPADQQFFGLPASQHPYQRAVGPMQFMPPTWMEIEDLIVDPQRPGRPNPQNIFDATRASVHYLCSAARGNILDPENKARAIDRYNPASYYLDRILKAEAEYRQMSTTMLGPGVVPAGVTPRTPEIAAVISWAVSMRGHGYASVANYRFGEVPWPGGSIETDLGTGTYYTHPAGAIVFDCSGFLIAAFKNGAGLDLRDWGLSGSQGFPGHPRLERVDRADLAAGDLIVYGRGSNGVGHIVMYLTDDTFVDASYPGGVDIRTGINWSRVTGILRVPYTELASAR